jgi:hypothetical protein
MSSVSLSRLPARFQEKIMPEPMSGCWIWIGARSIGYGAVGVGTKVFKAHRVVYELLVRKIPEGLHIDHLCRLTACCNPCHLEPVTPQINLHRGDTTVLAINLAKMHCPRGHDD